MIELGNCLFVGAHPDDIVSSCGGFIQPLTKTTTKTIPKWDGGTYPAVSEAVTTLCLTHGYTSQRVEEYTKGVVKLGVEWFYIQDLEDTKIELKDALAFIEDLMNANKIQTIFTHWYGSIHQDHRVVSEACRIACRKKNINLIYYEDWNHELSPFAWKPNLFFLMDGVTHMTKMRALQCHKSQVYNEYGNYYAWVEPISKIEVERFQIAYLVIK